MEEYMESILAGCGEVCDRSTPHHDNPNGLFDFIIKKNINCEALWGNEKNDQSQTEAPPKQMPDEMKAAYTYGNKVKVTIHPLFVI